jgi:hypothetical protein
VLRYVLIIAQITDDPLKIKSREEALASIVNFKLARLVVGDRVRVIALLKVWKKYVVSGIALCTFLL